MSKEKEILQRFFKGESQRSIAAVLQVSRNTVAKVIRACHEHRIDAASLDGMDLDALHHHLFPEKADLPCQVPPDYEFIHKELLKSGVTLKLLWEEYVADCRQVNKLYFMWS